MAIGRTFRESFAKAMRSRELDSKPDLPEDTGELLDRLVTPGARPLRPGPRGVPARRHAGGGRARGPRSTPGSCDELRALAIDGDGTDGLVRTYKSVDTCAAEFEAETPYYYSAYERGHNPPRPDERRYAGGGSASPRS